MLSDSRLLADIRKRAVTVVAVKHTGRAFEPVQVTIGPAFKEIASYFTVGIETQIIADEKIEITVIVIIKEGCARAPFLIVDSGARGDVGKRSLAVFRYSLLAP